MTTPVATVAPDCTAETVGRRLRDQGIGSVVVTAADGLDGVVELGDLVDLAVEDVDLAATPVGEVVTGDPPTVEAAASLQRTVDAFRGTDRKRLPVLDDGDLVGVVTTTDVATHLPHVGSRVEADGGLAAADRPGVNETAYDRADWTFADDGDRPTEIEQGETFEFEKTLSAADVAAFAEASGDTNRLHLDEEFAAETRFGRRIAHGTLAAGVVSAALARLPGTVVYLSQSLSFQGPVDIGETVTATVTAAERLGTDRWRFETALFDADGDRAIDGEATVLIDE